MARKNPVSRLTETAISTLKDPKTAAGKAVDQAKGTVALGKHVAEAAGSVAGQVVSRAAARRGGQQSPGGAGSTSARPTSPPDLRSVPKVDEAGQTTSSVGRSTPPAKKHGDVLPTPGETGGAATSAPANEASAKRPAKKAPAKEAAKKAPAKKAPAKEAAKKAPAKKAPAKKAPAKKAPAKKAPATKAPAKKVTATPADVAEVVESAVAESPEKTGARPVRTSAAKKAGAKAPAKKAPAKKASSPGGKLPAKKAQPAQPKAAAEVERVEGGDVRTPSGVPAAAEGHNPSTKETDLTQPGTAPLVDPSTAKQVAGEAEKLQKAADKEPGNDVT